MHGRLTWLPRLRRVECVPPVPMVVYVDNNNGPGSWLRLYIEVGIH